MALRRSEIKKENRMEFTKKELYRIAVEERIKAGFNQTKAIDLVAAECKVSRSVVYRAFTGKKCRKSKKFQMEGKRIILMPDTQIKHGEDTEHVRAAARYIVSKKPDIVVFLGDHWDCPSLSVFNSKKQSEKLRITDDLQAGNDTMNDFMEILNAGLSKRKMPELIYIVGNHDPQVRIPRYIESNPNLEGMLFDTTTPFLEARGFEVVPFLQVRNVCGFRIAHYHVNPHSAKGNALAGQMPTMLKNCGYSFIGGHQQGLKTGRHFLCDGTVHMGIVAGSFYQHDEDYMSVQANKAHWRGILMLNEAVNGNADICEVSLKYLLRRYGDGGADA